MFRAPADAEGIRHAGLPVEAAFGVDPDVSLHGLFPAPGFSMSTGVSLACSTCAPSTNLRWTSNTRADAAPLRPDQAASMDRGVKAQESSLKCEIPTCYNPFTGADGQRLSRASSLLTVSRAVMMAMP